MNEIKRGALNAIGAALVAVAIYYAMQALMPHEQRATVAGSLGVRC